MFSPKMCQYLTEKNKDRKNIFLLLCLKCPCERILINISDLLSLNSLTLHTRDSDLNSKDTKSNQRQQKENVDLVDLVERSTDSVQNQENCRDLSESPEVETGKRLSAAK